MLALIRYKFLCVNSSSVTKNLNVICNQFIYKEVNNSNAHFDLGTTHVTSLGKMTHEKEYILSARLH